MYGLPKSGAQQPNAAGGGIGDETIVTDIFEALNSDIGFYGSPTFRRVGSLEKLLARWPEIELQAPSGSILLD
jgi:hypothetical protein